jgi:hypothetical protein
MDGANNIGVITVISGNEATTEFEGLIVTRGARPTSPNWLGGGMFISASTVDINLSDFTDNSARVSIEDKKGYQGSIMRNVD